MNKTIKKTLSIILTILMIVSSVPFAFATEGTPVAKVGDVEYTDFVTAVANWTDGTTLTLLADTPEYNDNITIVNKSVTLDLNGHTLNFSGTENKRFMVGEYDSLTIRDSGTDGAINAYYCTVQNYGITNLQSGTLNGPVSNVGTFNMTGGKVIGYSKLHRTSTQAIDNHGTLNISGGEAIGRFGISANYESVTNISGSPVITGEDRGSNKGSAIRSANTDLIITISGTPTLTGGSWGELFFKYPHYSEHPACRR
ncbi:MAG: hypothetical protein IJ289_02565 [Clostridia bacterium]|nr:hypothetical protein [Clostridia bacterium]